MAPIHSSTPSGCDKRGPTRPCIFADSKGTMHFHDRREPAAAVKKGRFPGRARASRKASCRTRCPRRHPSNS
jgi:hypothetical protein